MKVSNEKKKLGVVPGETGNTAQRGEKDHDREGDQVEAEIIHGARAYRIAPLGPNGI